jgi:Glyoxalase/Bleomycin resistance protein/Dioxygenase superfamily
MSSSFFERLHRKMSSGGVERVTPILNVSNIQDSFAWFEKLGWKKSWDWGDPPDFGAVCSGEFEIYLCEKGQGQQVWMMIAVADVQEVYERCLANALEITWPPTDMPWNMREMHVRHPDGHVLRIGQGRE